MIRENIADYITGYTARENVVKIQISKRPYVINIFGIYNPVGNDHNPALNDFLLSEINLSLEKNKQALAAGDFNTTLLKDDRIFMKKDGTSMQTGRINLDLFLPKLIKIGFINFFSFKNPGFDEKYIHFQKIERGGIIFSVALDRLPSSINARLVTINRLNQRINH